MDPHTQWIMVGAFLVAAVAILVQACLMFAMYRTSCAMREQLSALRAKIEPMAESGQRLFEETRAQVAEISTETRQVLALGRKQLVVVDELMGEAAARTRAQMDRIEMVVDDTVNRFQETTTLLQNSIVKPIRQINALSAGIRAAVSVLFGGRRTSVERATHDEEMFI